MENVIRMRKRMLVVLAALSVTGALVLFACAPQTNTEGQGSSQSETDESQTLSTAQVEWGAETDCTPCHEVEKQSMSDSVYLASRHTDQRCTSCHGDIATLEAVHADTTASSRAPKRLKKTEVDEKLCLSCHYGSQEALHEATTDAKLVDKNGLEISPHNIPKVSSHATIACADCHSMHKATPTHEQAKALCAGCHHAEVFECGTCHQ
jgi:hypothetical protein